MPSAPAKAIHRLHRTPFLRAFITHRPSASTAYAILPLRINTHRTHSPTSIVQRPSAPEDVDWQKEAKAHDTRHGKKVQTLPCPSPGQCFQSGKLMGKEAEEKLPQKPTTERKTEGRRLRTHSPRTTHAPHARTLHTSHAFSHTPPPYVPTYTHKKNRVGT